MAGGGHGAAELSYQTTSPTNWFPCPSTASTSRFVAATHYGTSLNTLIKHLPSSAASPLVFLTDCSATNLTNIRSVHMISLSVTSCPPTIRGLLCFK